MPAMATVLALLLYAAPVFAIALLARAGMRRGGDPAQAHYLAGRRLGLVEVTGSVLATEVSALTFVGIPALAYTGDFSLIYFYLGTVPARLLIARLVVGRVRGGGLTLYAAMARGRGTGGGRRAMAALFAATKVLGVGVRFHAGSILIAGHLGLPMWQTLLLVTALTLCYSLVGGLAAVVRTDLLQACLFVGGGVAAHLVVPGIAGEGWGSMMGAAWDAGKVVEFDWRHLRLFCVGFVGGVVFDFCTHSFDQDYAQRLMGARDAATARRAIRLSALVSIFMGLLFLPVGSMLWRFHQSSPPPAGARPDELFALFIAEWFPPPLQAFMLVGALAATMSTLDSTINAVSSVLWNDLWPGRSPGRIRSWFMADALAIAAALLAVALLAGRGGGLFVLGMTVSSWTVGVFVPLLFMGRVRLDGPTVAFAAAANVAGVAANSLLVGGPWQWNVLWGAGAAWAALLLRGALSGRRRGR